MAPSRLETDGGSTAAECGRSRRESPDDLRGYAADQSGISSWSFWDRRFGIPLETVREYAELKRLSGTVRKGDVKTVP